MKSPTWLKLEAMIQTLNMYRNEMAGKRIPKFKQKYMEMKQREKDSERKVLNNQNSQRTNKSSVNQNSHRMSKLIITQQGSNARNARVAETLKPRKEKKKTGLALFASYHINDYMEEPFKKQHAHHGHRVTFDEQFMKQWQGNTSMLANLNPSMAPSSVGRQMSYGMGQAELNLNMSQSDGSQISNVKHARSLSPSKKLAFAARDGTQTTKATGIQQLADMDFFGMARNAEKHTELGEL